jgi:hypothetical protein
MDEGDIFYQSVVRGVASDKADTIYYGFISHVPRDVMRDPARIDAYMTGEMAKIDAFIASLPDDLEAGQPLERFEVYDAEADMDTGDILVMWRIPIHEKKTREL